MIGRCAGCGKTGQPKPVLRHVTECPAWLALLPARQLDPEAEYRRWLEQDRGDERDRRRERAIEASTAARQAVSGRFARSRDLDAELDEVSLAYVTEDPVAQVRLLELAREAGGEFMRGLEQADGQF